MPKHLRSWFRSSLRNSLISSVGLVQIRFAALCVFVVLLQALGAAQSADDVHITPNESHKGIQRELGAASGRLRMDVEMVLVPVTVTDVKNHPVVDLARQNFRLFEGESEEKIQYFDTEDAPLSVGILVDLSSSMSDKIDAVREAVSEFFKNANPEDDYFVITFADKPKLLANTTQSIEDINAAMGAAKPKGNTALADAIYMGLAKLHSAKYSRKALLVISDGGDNHSRYTEGEIKNLVKEADVMIYSIGIYDHYFQTEEERLGPALLSDISDLSGGRSFTIDNPNDLADVATKIGIELRNQYVLGYRPKNPGHDGKWHKIKVKLLPPKGLPPLHVYARTGYYASSQ